MSSPIISSFPEGIISTESFEEMVTPRSTPSPEIKDFSVEFLPPYVRLPEQFPSPYLPTDQKADRPPNSEDNEFPLGTYWYFDECVYVLREYQEDVAMWEHLILDLPPQG